jgi:hypothetical protein
MKNYTLQPQHTALIRRATPFAKQDTVVAYLMHRLKQLHHARRAPIDHLPDDEGDTERLPLPVAAINLVVRELTYMCDRWEKRTKA